MNLLRLSHLVQNAAWDSEIDRTLAAFGGRIEQMGRAVPMMAAALSTRLAGVQQIVLAGSDQDRSSFARIVARHYLPFAITINLGDRAADRVEALLPLVAAMRPQDGKSAAYVCRDFTCEAPVNDPAALEKLLSAV